MKTLIVVAACVLLGLAAGGIWSWAQADRYRADARVLVQASGNRIGPAIEALAESSLVEANIAQTLHLSSPPDVSAKPGEGGVLTISVEAGSRERARQIDAEAVVILMQKVEQRFGTTPGVTATVLDPAHPAEQTSPTPWRNLLIGGLAGLVVGVGAAVVLTAARARAGPLDDGVEERLRSRIEAVALRERALARRAGELAVREQQLAGSEKKSGAEEAVLAQRERELRRGEQELEQRLTEGKQRLERRAADLAAREAALEETPVDEQARQAMPEVAPVESSASGWDLQRLERLVREHSPADSALQEEWDAYLFFLREHANHDGVLPSSFDGLIADVFGGIPDVLLRGNAR